MERSHVDNRWLECFSILGPLDFQAVLPEAVYQHFYRALPVADNDYVILGDT